MFQQSAAATRLALRVHAKAVRRRNEREKALPVQQASAEVERLEKLVGELQDVVRSHYRITAVVRIMVRRYKADAFKGRADQWLDLARQIEVLDRCR